jgi:hypothetical protein
MQPKFLAWGHGGEERALIFDCSHRRKRPVLDKQDVQHRLFMPVQNKTC